MYHVRKRLAPSRGRDQGVGSLEAILVQTAATLFHFALAGVTFTHTLARRGIQ